MDLHSDLLTRAEAFCSRTGIPKAKLGRVVAKDSKFFKRVEAGGGFTVKTYERFLRHFREHAREDTA